MNVDPDIVIIGAGFAGLLAARQLKLRGHTDFIIAERRSELGGVWRDNQYPNAACDIPIELYSLSFRAGTEWSCNYAPSAEIAAYAKTVWQEQGLVDFVRFDTWIAKAVWSGDIGRWQLETNDGRRWTPRFVIWAGGRLGRPLIPEIPGMDDFTGPIFHTAAWRHDVDIAGKRVAIVGGGASSLQVLPDLADCASHLTAFIRTPSYVMPRPDEYYDDAARRRFREDPHAQTAGRKKWFDFMCDIARQRFPMDDARISEVEAKWREFFETQVTDPDLRATLVPNYRFGFRRPGFSNLYYKALARPNVTAKRSGLVRMTESGGFADDGSFHEFDIAVMATGFQVKAAEGHLDVIGRNSVRLREQWDEGEEGYLGVFIKNFPNFFTIDGPNTSVGSILDIFEHQAELIGVCIDWLNRNGLDRIEVKGEIQDAFNQDLDRRAAESVMIKGGDSSWHLANGKGRLFTHWPGSPDELIGMLQMFRQSEFLLQGAEPRVDLEPIQC